MPIDDEHEVLKVDGDIEAIEAVEKREPEGELEALDLGGDGEAHRWSRAVTTLRPLPALVPRRYPASL